MARADRRRTARAKPVTAGGRYQSASVGTDALFFQRLRTHAKWIFVLLALVFGLSFVVFGVGSEVPGGVADILQGRSASGAPSVDEAREKLDENPNDATALRELSTALQAAGRQQEAIDPLVRYTTQRPRDAGALRELAGLYLAKAARVRNQVAELQARAQFAAPGGQFLPPASTPLGQALAERPLDQAQTAELNEQVAALYSEMAGAYEQAKLTYTKIANLEPDDAAVQLQLADAALNAGDQASAIAAYERFLELAPDDPNAGLVREQLKQLKESSSAATGG